jgi:hypothetical protein
MQDIMFSLSSWIGRSRKEAGIPNKPSRWLIFDTLHDFPEYNSGISISLLKDRVLRGSGFCGNNDKTVAGSSSIKLEMFMSLL